MRGLITYRINVSYNNLNQIFDITVQYKTAMVESFFTPQELSTSQLLLQNAHAVQSILGFLNRKKKMQTQQLNRSFRDHISFKSLVSVRFIHADVITKSTLLQSCVEKARKVTKLTLEEVVVDMEYVNALERAFMINKGADESDENSIQSSG